ncbi:MAG: DUF1800 family protein [Phycisphaerales bacterium]
MRPFSPTAQRPWDRSAAGRLLRAAGFAPTPEEITRALDDGAAATVDRIVSEETPQSDRVRELDELVDRIAAQNDIDALRGWWLLRMRHSSRPLRDRLTLFWMNHFATSDEKVQSASLMLGQMRTLERYALGRFEEMVKAISRDPAMIIWLDGDENVKGRPNENYARELFELFTLGVGHYTEQDIKEAARAFTGWGQHRGRFRYSTLNHDGGLKTVFGDSGRFDGDDIVRLSLARPACSHFIGTKLIHEFITPHPTRSLIDSFARRLRETGFDILESMRTLLGSEAMFDPSHVRTRIKSPVEFVLGIARSLDLRIPATTLAEAVSNMGQPLFEPPSVAGWEGHRSWMNSATMLVRLNTVAQALRNDAFEFAPQRMLNEYALDTNDKIDRFAIELTLDGHAPESLVRQLREVEVSDGPERLRTTLRMTMTAPEYQLV